MEFLISSRCCVTINFKIKLNTKATRNKDKLVEELPCIITMKGKHNHSTNSAAALNQMRQLPDVREEFMRYFDLGKVIVLSLHLFYLTCAIY